MRDADECNTIFCIVIIAFFALIWGGAQILNMPVIVVYRFGIYFTAYLLGYAVFSHDEVMERVEKICIPTLVISVIAGITYVIYYWGQDYTSPKCLQSLFTNFYAWITILAILGSAKRWLNHTSAFLTYMTKASFGIYILHYPILLAVSYFLYMYCPLPDIMIYAIALVGEFVLTPLCYEIIRRIPVIRYLVLGITKRK